MPKSRAKPSVTVIVGPAHSAKTARVIRAFRDSLARGDDAVLVLPTFDAAASLRTSLLLDGTFDFFGGPRILTFTQFAGDVLQHHAPEVQPIGAVVADELLARIVEDLAAEGKIAHHASVLQCRGFVRAVREFIDELKRAEIAPDRFARYAARKGAPAKDGELSAIYSRYHDALSRLNLYDHEGRFWRAKLLVSEGKLGPFAALKHVFLDGFYDFTPTQLGLLDVLGRRGVAVTLTLPLEDDAARGELFETAEATLAALRDRFDVSLEESPRGKESAEAALGWITDHLFRTVVPGNAPPPDAIRIIEAPGAAAEVREIAREIKRLHLDEKVPLDRIAVLFRTLGEYRDVVEETFEEFGIPARIAQGVRLSQTSVGQLFLQFLRVPAEGWRRVDVMGLVKSSYVSPEAVGLGGAGGHVSREGGADIPVCPPQDRQECLSYHEGGPSRQAQGADAALSTARFEDLVVEAGIIGGRDGWLRNLRALRERTASQLAASGGLSPLSPSSEKEGTVPSSRSMLGELDDEAPRPVTADALHATLDDVDRAIGVCEKLFALFAPVESARTATDAVRALLAAAAALQIEANLRASRRDVVVRDLESLSAVREALDGLVRTSLIVGRSECTLADLSRDLALAFADLAVSRHATDFGRVRVCEVHDVRALSFDVVFIGGMLERSFPRMHREGPFYDDREREAMSKAGLPLEPRRLTQREERFLFYLAATRAKRRLYLSYPVTDREGKEKLVSYYVDEVRKLFRSREIPVRRVTLSTKTVGIEEASSSAELRRAAVLRLSESRLREPLLIGRVSAYLWKTGGECASSRLAQGAEAALVLKRGLEGEAERDAWAFFGAHDGVIAHPAALDDLARRFGADHGFSVTSLEQYGGCPFAFFCHYVLGVEAPAVPPETIEAVDEGTLLHRALREFYAQRRDAGAGPLTENDAEPATKRLLDIADRHLGRFRRDNPDVGEGLLRLQRETIRRTLSAFVQREIAEAAADELVMTPRHLEAVFGLPANPRAADPISTMDRLVLAVGGGPTVSIVGKIDRIDVGQPRGQSRTPTFRVVDYKRGGSPGARDIEEGTSLQMPVYVLAARDVLFRGRECEPVEARYYELARAKVRAVMSRVRTVRNAPDWDQCLRLAQGFIESYVIDIRGGLFPVVRRGSSACPGYCEYSDICRYTESRARKKSGDWQPWFMRGKADVAHPPSGE